jgi:NADH-quinone oxidoreductase subunit L
MRLAWRRYESVPPAKPPVFKALLFLGAGAVIHAVGTRDMRLMGGLGPRMKFTRNTFVIGALALAGIPILNGFWSKELILKRV